MTKLYYIHDPVCSWCWGFTATLQQLLSELPDDIAIVRLRGGLASDTEIPMPETMQLAITATWHRIEAKIPGLNSTLISGKPVLHDVQLILHAVPSLPRDNRQRI